MNATRRTRAGQRVDSVLNGVLFVLVLVGFTLLAILGLMLHGWSL